MGIHTDHQRRLTTAIPSSAGFSLVELLVAMVLGLILLAGVVTVVTRTSFSFGEADKASRQLENGRFALAVLTEDIQHAGFYGAYSSVDLPTALPTAAQQCDTSVGALDTWLSLPIHGYSGATDSPLNSACLTNANYKSNTDIVVVRRTATEATPLASLVGTRRYLQGAFEEHVLDLGSNSGNFNLNFRPGTPADIYQVLVHIYFISPCNVCAGTSADAIPTLKLLELTNGAWQIIPLAEGVENMQLDYAIDANQDGSPEPVLDGDGDGALDLYVPDPGADPTTATANWGNVVGMRVSLLARNSEPTPDYTDAKSYTLGSANVAAANDSFKRHVYSNVVRVVNVSARRQ